MTISNEKPFHSRIFRIYLSYLRTRLLWSETQINDFLSSISISRERLEDEASWFSVDFADQFYDRLQQITRDPGLAYKAGQYVHEISASPVIHRLIRGMLDVSFVYRLLTRVSGHFTKAAKFNIVSVGSKSAVVESIPLAGFKERPYMCENRRGMLEGVPLVFGLPSAIIIEPECLHRGGAKCTYQLSWEQKSNWVTVFRLAGLVLLFGFLFWLYYPGMAFLGGSVGLLIGAAWRFHENLSEQKSELLRQNEALDQTLKEIERRNQQLQLIGQISQLTHSLMSPQDLAKTIVKRVCDILGYDRCLLLMTDFERQILKVTAHEGFSSEMTDIIEQAEFNLSQENSAGFFVKVVNSKSPLLISDVASQIDKLSPRSQKFARVLGSKSFVAVPLIDESQEVVGVLSVDQVTIGKTITITDQDLLMTLAEHVGIALHNAKMIKQLESNLDISRKLTEDEKILREVFQKFIPRDLSGDLVAAAKSGQQISRLNQVRKRSVCILFLDIFNFSTLVENLEPESAVEILNTAFGVFEPIVASHQGYVDKFMGDGMLSVFETGNQSDLACSASLHMIGALSTVHQQLQSKGLPPIDIGIGINFGEVILGNIGSDKRLNFTAIGDSVNLAARLQSHTRSIGPNSVCISESVQTRLSENLFKSNDLGRIPFKGYAEPIQTYQLVPGSSLAPKSLETLYQSSGKRLPGF